MIWCSQAMTEALLLSVSGSMGAALAGSVRSKLGLRLIGASLSLLIGHGGSRLWPPCPQRPRRGIC